MRGGSGGMKASEYIAAELVDWKQFVIQIPTLRQKVDMCLRVLAGGGKISAPYSRAGRLRTWARCQVALGLRPLPKSDSLLTFVQAAFAKWSRLEKCCCVEWLSCSQKPSHLTEVEGLMISPSRATGVL